MKLSSVTCAVFAVGSAIVVYGAQYKMSANDASGESSFNTSGHWVLSSSATAAESPPCPNNTYVSNGKTIRTPANTAENFNFGGDSLTVKNSALQFSGQTDATITIASLISSGGCVMNGSGRTHFSLAGAIAVVKDTILKFQTPEPLWRGITVKAPISGSGSEIWLQLPRTNLVTSAEKYVCLEGDNSGFTGKFRATGGGYFIVNSDVAFGAVPASATADAITINGPAWVITNDIVTAATRGITILDGLNTAATPVESNCHPGMRLNVSDNATIWFCGPVSGAGPIIRTGDAGITHFTGSFADFTGAVSLEKGVTWFDGRASVSLSSVTVSAGLGLSSNQLEVTTLVCEKGELRVALTNADADVPRLVVTDSVAFTHENQLVIREEDVAESVYGVVFQLVKAPGHVVSDALANGWIATDNPRMLVLSVRDNGDGTETLHYVHRPAGGMALIFR